MTYERMADAAYAANIPPGFAVAAGYYGGPLAYHTWLPEDWGRFPGHRLPIWVAGHAAESEGPEAVAALRALGVPQGSLTVADMETREDAYWLNIFHGELAAAGYKVLVYGSASSVFGNPPLNGYWVADYTTDLAEVDRLMQHPAVRAVQFAANVAPGYDASLLRAWAEGEMWHG